MAPTSIVERIQLLLNKAERTDNEHEADAFFAAAQSLMQRHAIEEQDLPGNERKEVIVKRVMAAKKTMAMRSAMARLLGGIAKANRCRLVNAANRLPCIEQLNHQPYHYCLDWLIA